MAKEEEKNKTSPVESGEAQKQEAPKERKKLDKPKSFKLRKPLTINDISYKKGGVVTLDDEETIFNLTNQTYI